MRSGARPNEFRSHAWAAVACGQAWLSQTLIDGTCVKTEFARGALIIWAKNVGRGIAKFGLEEITASILKPRVPPPNTEMQFRAYYWEAGWDVVRVYLLTYQKINHLINEAAKIPFLRQLLQGIRERRKAGIGIRTAFPTLYKALARAFAHAAILRLLIGIRFRQYLINCIRLVRRRARAPRPLCTRPRPPAAPLAPPMA